MGSDIKEGSKVQRATGQLQGMACEKKMNIALRKLTGWVTHSRPNRCPEMIWGRTLKKALKCKGLPVNFKEWRAEISGDSYDRHFPDSYL